MTPGKIIGSFIRFLSTSSIKATFHLNLLICHTPRKPVRIGTKIRTRVVGLKRFELNTEVEVEDDDDDEEEDEEEAEVELNLIEGF